MSKRIAKKVMLIGWDAADWKAINPLMDAGLMPSLEKLVNGGVMGNLATLDPPLSPMLWTSMATGKRPYKHGILGFTEADPSGTGVRPVHITSRKVKAIWNMMMQKGMKASQVGWWPSHPAEPINGTYISNFYQRANKPIYEKWEMLPGTVHPPEKSDLFAHLRIHPQELTEAHLLPFIPNASQLDQTDKQNQGRLNSLRSIIADTATIHSAATYIAENEDWDLLGVYFDGIDHFGHGFMKYHPPKMDKVSQEDFDMWHNVVKAGYQFHDMILGRLMELADEDTTIMLVSDHGFHPDHLRPKNIPKEPAGPAAEHSPYGIVVLNGPGIKKDERIYGASLLDVTPTLLQLFGLPLGDDMDGKVMIGAFEEIPKIATIPTWEEVPGECGMHPKDYKEDPSASKAAMEQLIELGYIERPDDNGEKAIASTLSDNNFYLARSYINGGKILEAIPLLEKLAEEQPTALHFKLRLVNCYIQLKQTKKAREIVQEIRKVQKEINPHLLFIQGRVVMQEKNYSKALSYFRQIQKDAPDLPQVHLEIGNCLMKLERWSDAASEFLKELKINKESHRSFLGLGFAQLRLKQYDLAVDYLLNCISLIFHTPSAHFYLGEAFYQLEQYERSAQAFEIFVRMSPGGIAGKRWLVKIYNQHLNQPKRAATYQVQIPDEKRPEILIVSGLPRSGTSMMMQMITAGGFEAFTDTERIADENNPKGYLEHEAVKRLMKDNAFLDNVGDRVVKIISHLLFHLPNTYRYKIVFMERALKEVVQSQHKMLVRLGKAKADTYPTQLEATFRDTIKRIKETMHYRPHVKFLFVPHREVLQNPMHQAQRVQEFIGKSMDLEQMAAVVDPSLYREKVGNNKLKVTV